ncbi:MAG: 50S ribosomal protein L18e [Methanomethylovorans sp.]|uniref:50S ribosomal protein L18e n=1 Tax=Methanomethylovorans sp. TaxID=2758717 RepID=UPI003C77B39F
MGKKTQRKITRKTNPRIPELISTLKEESRNNDVLIWKDIAKRLERPSRRYAQVNLSKINRYAKEGELVLIPGKVLGAGELKTSVTIAALDFSGTAIDKINEIGGKYLTIEQVLEENPSGSNIRILQ